VIISAPQNRSVIMLSDGSKSTVYANAMIANSGFIFMITAFIQENGVVLY